MMIAQKHITCASHRCCYEGWTKRFYSVLERTVITLDYMVGKNSPLDLQKYMCLDEVKETFAGYESIPLYAQHGLDIFKLSMHDIENIRAIVTASERVTVFSGKVFTNAVRPDPDIMSAIKYDHVVNSAHWIPSFNAHYERLF